MNEPIRCSTCVLPASFPGEAFDAEGRCHNCQEHSPEASREARAAGRRELETVYARYRGWGSPNCVLAFSGGKDSAFTLAHLVREAGLKPLAVLIDHGAIAGEALENASRVCAALEVDLLILKPAPSLFRRLVRASLELPELHPPSALRRASAICLSCISLINAQVTAVALEKAAPILAGGYVSGQHPDDRPVLRIPKAAKHRLGELQAQRFGKLLGPEVQAYFTLPEHRYTTYPHPELTLINPLLATPIAEREKLAALAELGWRQPPGTGRNSSNCLLNDLAVILHQRRHGFHPYVFEVAAQVRNGELSRSEALAKLSLDHLDPADFHALARQFGLDPSVLDV
ncbi:MAG: hypothetical protein A2284_15865 [Deltaproteobacteria bacterium RIFOXYA12_FULL_61_11]|nr:MAG: hypothetical protein A2284_15865 [Deltaproteobacteria bacterium RIFOXYA12_FULL_61_11]